MYAPDPQNNYQAQGDTDADHVHEAVHLIDEKMSFFRKNSVLRLKQSSFPLRGSYQRSVQSVFPAMPHGQASVPGYLPL